jgi:hypothetical protein
MATEEELELLPRPLPVQDLPPALLPLLLLLELLQ